MTTTLRAGGVAVDGVIGATYDARKCSEQSKFTYASSQFQEVRKADFNNHL